jgi:hypothetical protein
MDAALMASRNAGRLLSASGARQNVVKGAAEQTDDGIKFLIVDCHVAGKIAFDEQRRLMITPTRFAGDGNVAPNRPGRPRL